MAERLAMLTTHINADVRHQVHQCQLHIIRGRPKYRNAVTVEMCNLIQKIPWDVEVQTGATELLLALLQHWHACLNWERDLTQEERGQEEAGDALDVAHLEGYGLLTLCSPSPKLRVLGFKVLQLVRQLHMCASACAVHMHLVVNKLWLVCARGGHVWCLSCAARHRALHSHWPSFVVPVEQLRRLATKGAVIDPVPFVTLALSMSLNESHIINSINACVLLDRASSARSAMHPPYGQHALHG
jgi:hypothetical protein